MKDAVKTVTSQEVVVHKGDHHKVVLWDFGAKENIEKCLVNYGCEVICVPSITTAEQILSYEPMASCCPTALGTQPKTWK